MAASQRTLELNKACIDSDLLMVKDLVENHKHDPHLKDENGDTALNVAAYSGKLEILKYLIEECNCSTVCLGRNDRTPLHNACQDNGNLHVVRYLMEKHNCHHSVKDKHGDTPLNVAALSGHLDIVTYFIEEKNCTPECPGQWGRSPLHNACLKSPSISVVKYLVESHACDHSKKDDRGDTALNVAALSGSLDILQYFIDTKKFSAKCPGRLGRMLLHNACEENGNLAVVKYLIEQHDCDPSEKDKEGNTPLHIAAYSGHLDIVIYFIEEKRCNPECLGSKNRTPLYYACRRSLDIVKYLVEKHRCDPIHKDKNGNLPLSAAVHFDNLSVLKYFLEEKKCDPRIRAAWNRSLLHIASIIGNLHVVKYLVEEQGVGCDFHYKDTNGFIPLDGATSANITSVITYLKERMGITLPPCQPILPSGTVQVQDEKTRIWIPQTLSGTPVEWIHPSISNDLGPMVPGWCPIQLWDGKITFVNIETKKRVAEDPRRVVRRYKQALKNGFVSAYLMKVFIIGAAGVGKTHLLHLLFNEPPPDVRRSTSLMERPVQAIQTVLKDSNSFEKITNAQLYELLGHSVNDNVKSNIDSEKSRSSQQSSEMTTPYTETAPLPATLQPTLMENKISEVEENLVPFIADSKDASPLTNIDWVYFIDSGGQPQFHQLLPAFICHTNYNTPEPLHHNSLNIFVLRLCDKLSDQPTIEFYEEGKCTYSSKSLQTNMEILRCCAQPIQAADKDGNSRLIIVGTHRDLESEEETTQDKNKLLLQLLKPSDNGYVMSNSRNEVIFSLNTIEPDETDKVIINKLRASILSIRQRMKPQNIPLKWLVFHQELQDLTNTNHTDVLSFEQCTEVATRLQMKDDTAAALIFLSSLNVILYYPTVLPDVVFVNSQSLLNIVTCIIKYIVYGTECSHTTDPVLIKACYKGILSIKILEWMEIEMPQLYKQFMVKAQDLIKLFLHLGIVCKVKDDYLMPSLLKGLEADDLEKLLSKHPDSVAPCAVCYKDRWLECGAFAFLVTSLLSSKEWMLELDELAQPLCVYSNIIKMRYSEFSLVTLVDYVSHIEIHIHDDNIQMLRDICPKIVSSIVNSFKVKPRLAFVCPCQQFERHVVIFSTSAVQRKEVICSKNSSKRFKLEERGDQPLVWIVDPVQVLTSNYKELVNCIQNANALASSLYTSEIITGNIRDMVYAADGKDKNEVLLKAIREAVSTSPRAYEAFRNDVLKEQPLLQNLLCSLSYID